MSKSDDYINNEKSGSEKLASPELFDQKSDAVRLSTRKGEQEPQEDKASSEESSASKAERNIHIDNNEPTKDNLEENVKPATPNEQTQLLSSRDDKKKNEGWRYWITVWATMLVWLVILWLLIPIYLQLHGISAWRLGLSGFGFQVDPESLQTFSDFNYVGYPFPDNEPTAASLWVEVLFWSYCGAAVSLVYNLTQLISKDKKKFEAGKRLVQTFGTIMRAFALSTAVIFLLRIVTLTIGPVEISLRRADIQTVIAISFILGFYNEDTERALRRLWQQTARTVGASSDV